MNGPLLYVGIAIAIIVIVWVGLQVEPAPFPAFDQPQPPLDHVSLPAGLPAPVERFYRQTYGESIPVIHTAVIRGRGRMRLGVFFPIRFRFTHESGQAFRHDIHLTFYGIPLLKANETMIDGRGWANTPGFKAGEGFDQGSNVTLWAEILNWFPAALLTDPRVAWQPVDDATALLVVPFGAAHEVLVVRFDPESGKVQYIEAMKYKASIDKKMLWNNGVWFDDGKPWIHFNVEDVQYNLDVQDYIRAEIVS